MNFRNIKFDKARGGEVVTIGSRSYVEGHRVDSITFVRGEIRADGPSWIARIIHSADKDKSRSTILYKSWNNGRKNLPDGLPLTMRKFCHMVEFRIWGVHIDRILDVDYAIWCEENEVDPRDISEEDYLRFRMEIL